MSGGGNFGAQAPSSSGGFSNSGSIGNWLTTQAAKAPPPMQQPAGFDHGLSSGMAEEQALAEAKTASGGYPQMQGFGGFSTPFSHQFGAPQQVAQPQMNWQTGQPAQPQFTTSSATASPAQQWWTHDPGAVAAGGQEGLNANLRQGIQSRMGNMGSMFNAFNAHGVSQADVQNAIGQGTDMYTYMNRPNYQQYSPNGQFNQPIYQSNYQNYNVGNPMAISQYGQGPDYYGAGLSQMMSTPFNPYTNSYQTPFSAQRAQPNYGPSQAIVSRSAGMRGTPNVVRRAEGGIASLVNDE